MGIGAVVDVVLLKELWGIIFTGSRKLSSAVVSSEDDVDGVGRESIGGGAGGSQLFVWATQRRGRDLLCRVLGKERSGG